MAVTLGIYYLTPWIRWDRGPYAPDQAVLVDLADRRFYFFFIEIWPQEFYFIAGLLIMAGIGLFLVTSLVRPRLVRLHLPADGLDRSLPRRRALDRRRPQRAHQARRRRRGLRQDRQADRQACRSGSLIAVGHRRRLDLLFRRRADAAARASSPARRRPIAYITVAVLTATTYMFGGFMREQVCTYMCPWPRIQARDARRALADRSPTTTGAANRARGMPRRRAAGTASATASTATPASPSARWASTSATASSSNASPARCASTPATASWTSSASSAA